MEFKMFNKQLAARELLKKYNELYSVTEALEKVMTDLDKGSEGLSNMVRRLNIQGTATAAVFTRFENERRAVQRELLKIYNDGLSSMDEVLGMDDSPE
jgi:hypothetical protein